MQLPEMLILFWGFVKNWRFYIREKWGGIQQMRNSTNSQQNSNAAGIMVQIESQEDEKECRMTKENYEWITDTLEKIEFRLKSLEGDKELTTRKETREWITERFEKMESRLEYVMQKID